MNAVLARRYDELFNALGAGHPITRYHYRRLFALYGAPVNFFY